MMNTYVSFVGAGIVILAISAICHLFLLVIHDNYIFPPTRWTVKAFLLTLFILSVPSICITWVLSKVFRKHHVEGDAEKCLECNVEKRKLKILVIDDYRFIAEGIRTSPMMWYVIITAYQLICLNLTGTMFSSLTTEASTMKRSKVEVIS